MKEKLYLVKREVRARNIKEAMNKDGVIYEIVLADEKFQQEEEKKETGFNVKKC